VAIAGPVGGGVFKDGISAHGVADVRATFPGDAASAAFSVEFGTSVTLFGAAIDGRLVTDFLGSGLGVRAVVGSGRAVDAAYRFPRRAGVRPPSRRLDFPEHFHLLRERQRGVLRSAPLQFLPWERMSPKLRAQ
jgi:hypothetical protein